MSPRIGAGLCLLAFVTSLPAQQNPTWWDEVIRSGDDHSIEANYRPANLGQLKNVAEQARLHLDEELASLGGAGEVIQNLIEEWEPVVPSQNYAPINLGQLKYVADLFYARLDEVGFDFRPQLIAQGYGGMWTGSPSRPWNEATPAEENYAPANIGQLKALFTFDLSPLADSDYDSMPDWFEQKIIDASLADDDPNNDITTFAQVTLNGDFDGDGLTNGRELELGSDPTDPTSGLNAALLGWWTFNEGYGNVIYDSSPYSRHGTLTASYAWHKVPWERKYIEFTDSTGRAEIPSSDLLLGENNSDFTVAFWMKVNQGPTGNWRVLAHKGNNDAERTFAMWLRPDSMQIHYRISGNHPNGNMGNDSDPTKPVPVGSWTHIAYVKQGSTLRIYINGVSAGSAGLPGPVVANNGPIYIGHNLIHNNSKAAFDDFRIYKVALNAAEIASLQQQEDLDTDHDTLSDAFEALVGTNPTLPDSDWDGIGDAQEVKVDGTDPNNPDSVIHRRIAYFPFDATDWRGNEGQVRRPLGGGQTAATQVTSFWGRALHIGQSGQFHAYDWCRSDGSPNYSFYKGTIRLWIKPDWSAPGMSGTWSRLYEIGALWGTSGKSWQQIRFWASGQATMNFNANDGAGHGYDHETPSSPGFNWAAGTWHEVVMTYSPSGRKFYVDGQQIDSTTKPWPYKPKIEDLIQYGLKFGTEGSQPLKGALDEVEIYNYELSSQEVLYGFQERLIPDENNNFVNDDWEDQYNPPNDPPGTGWWTQDSDDDGLSNAEEAAFNTDPNNPSSSNTGITDGWAADNGYNPGTITGYEDDDEDGLTLLLEYESNTNPQSKHSDSDGVPDGEDGWANDPDLYPPRVPEARYVAIPLSQLGITGDIVRMKRVADSGKILWVDEDSETHDNTHRLWTPGAGGSTVESEHMSRDGLQFVTTLPAYVDDGALSSNLMQSDYVADISNTGTVVGTGSVTSSVIGASGETQWRTAAVGVAWPGGGAPQEMLATRVQSSFHDFIILEGGDRAFQPWAINAANGVVGTWEEVDEDSFSYGGGYIPSVPSSAMEELPTESDSFFPNGINDLNPPWISADNDGAVFFVKVDGEWKRKPVFGKGGLPITGNGTLRVNNRCEMLVTGTSTGPGSLRNAVFRTIAELCPTYDSSGTLKDMNNYGVILTSKQLLLPIEFVEVTPSLVNEEGTEIPNSTKPKLIPAVNDMVEEPRAGQIPNVAYRILKVKLPKEIMAGEKVKWTMTPQFTPQGESDPRFRGQWPQSHPDRFEAAPDNGYGFERISQEAGRTTVDSEGFVAVRINLPPIGYNKARVKLELEKYPGASAEIDFEVPAVVVIDPGHGGTQNLPGSSWNNATSPTGVLEKNIALSYALDLRDVLKAKAKADKLNVKVYMTREIDDNVAGSARAHKARDNGADVIFIIHFNASANHTARGTLAVRRVAGNVNQNEDMDFINDVIDRIVPAIQTFDPGANKRFPVDNDTSVASDANLGNTAAYHPIRAGYCEVEFLDNATVDTLLNTGPNAAAVKKAIVEAMRDGILSDLMQQPAAP